MFSQAVQQVRSVGQVRKARLFHPCIQSLGLDLLACRVASLLGDDTTVLPSPSDFDTFLLSIAQRADALEKDSRLRGLTLWKTWAHDSMECGARAAHRWTKVDLAQHGIKASLRQGVEVPDPWHIVDDEMGVWSELWQRHDQKP